MNTLTTERAQWIREGSHRQTFTVEGKVRGRIERDGIQWLARTRNSVLWFETETQAKVYIERNGF